MRITLDPFLRMLHSIFSILPERLRAIIPDPTESGFQSGPPRINAETSSSSSLLIQAKRYASSPTDEFRRMSPGDRERLLKYLYAITTEVMKRDHPRAEADLLHMADSQDPLAGVARQMYSNMYLLFELYYTDDLTEFGRIIQVYFGRVFERISYLIEEGPSRFKNVSNYAVEISYGPSQYIYLLLEKKFGERIKGEPELEIMRHDVVNRLRLAGSFENEKYWGERWTGAAIKRLASMHKLARSSSNIYARTLKTILPYVIYGTTIGIGIKVQIDRNIRYRDGLDLAEIDYILVEFIHNAMKYHSYKRKGRFIRIKWNDERGVLVVEDNGRGIKNKDIIWKLGQREAERNPDVEGTGVGLYSVRQRLRKLGWTVELKSKVNEGTTFVIHPRPGDIVKDDSADSGSQRGGTGSGAGLSPSDISSYTSPHQASTLYSFSRRTFVDQLPCGAFSYMASQNMMVFSNPIALASPAAAFTAGTLAFPVAGIG